VNSHGWGPDAVQSILRHRGHVLAGEGDLRHILLPLRGDPILGDPVISGEDFNRFVDLFGKRSFRQVARQLIAAHGASVPLATLRGYAAAAAVEYVEFLESLGVARRDDDQATVTRNLDNIGPTLEWYVAELCRRELSGSSAWGVKLDGLTPGGDYDVLAWLPPTLMYVETKSSHPSQVSDGDIRNFLQRSSVLAPEMAVLLVDTSESMDDLLQRLFELMLPPLRESSGIKDETWCPDEPFVRPQAGYPGISWGCKRIYVTNSKPTILTQLRRCLQHYHARVKGASFFGGPPINWITGQVGAD
jgi:hypothetical protein